MNDIDATPATEPLTPVDDVAAPILVPILADETPPTRARATSSRSLPGRGLVGIIAISLLSASLSAAITVGALAATAADPAATATTVSTDPTTGTTPRTISANDAVVAVAESASPAVVTITVDVTATGFRGQTLEGTGVGSGFVFDADGLILTNDHVIDGATGGGITVTFSDGTELPGTVVATDPTLDLAVVQVTPPTALPTLEIGDSAALEVGQLVVAIGSPLGTFTETVTSGILSATDRTIEVAGENGRTVDTLTGLLQTDAAINQGNSGGPLLDASGRVIGVNVAVATSAQGIGFAVPIDAAAEIMAEAQTTTAAA